jgi:membrane-bound lytic murein transglycosylase B
MMRLFSGLTFGLLLHMSAAAETFENYLERVKARAVTEGIAAATVDMAFSDLERDERVIGFDRRQPEFVQTFDEYLEARVTDYRRNRGVELFRQHEALLARIAAEYKVDPEYLVAFWGLETNFGQYQGKYSIVRSLATLGHDPRRSTFFTNELVNALRILDEGHISPEKFVGAWAGAMGQAQFMPSSFLNFAQDFDGDGRKDIWASEADVFASIANYLALAGWKPGAGWGTSVSGLHIDWSSLKDPEPETRCRALRHHSVKKPLSDWQELGVSASGLRDDQDYALFLKSDDAADGYLVGGNFRAILSYNCANKYAVSVGLLADWIKEHAEP